MNLLLSALILSNVSPSLVKYEQCLANNCVVSTNKQLIRSFFMFLKVKTFLFLFLEGFCCFSEKPDLEFSTSLKFLMPIYLKNMQIFNDFNFIIEWEFHILQTKSIHVSYLVFKYIIAVKM